MLKLLERIVADDDVRILAYCLMGNHIHLVVKEGKKTVGQALNRIKTSYSQWYNRDLGRTGHMFGDRFHSEPVEDDVYLLSVMAYVFQNPVKAKICQRPEDYHWSSFGDLAIGAHNPIISRLEIEAVADIKGIIQYTKSRKPVGEHIV